MSATKRCRICGEVKPQDTFTTAYKDTCKDCRNKQLRDERALLKQLTGKKEEILYPKADWGQRLVNAAISIHAARINKADKSEPSPAVSVRIAKELIGELISIM